MPNQKIEGRDRTFAYIRHLNFSQLVAEGKTIFLMNATNADHFTGKVRVPVGTTTYSAVVLNRYLVAEPNQMRVVVDQKGVLNLDFAVQQGGVVVLNAIPTPQRNSVLGRGAVSPSPESKTAGRFFQLPGG